MKTTISILSIAFLSIILLNQTGNAQCIYCNSNTIGDSSSAIGAENISTGAYSLASGFQNEAIGDCSLSLGEKCFSGGEASFSAGYNATATEITSFAIGRDCEASGIKAFVYGVNSISNHGNAYAFGYHLISSRNYSFVIGAGTANTALENNIDNSLMIGFNSSKPTLFVSESSGIDKTGRIGIGNITEPEAKLHIKGDTGEEASIFIQPTNGYAKLYLGDFDHYIQATTYYDMTFHTQNNFDFIFSNGNVGIGIGDPDAKLQVNGNIFIDDNNFGLILKSPDGQCWKGAIDNDGSFNFESVDCSFLTGKDNSQGVSKKAARIYPNPAGNKVFVEIPDGLQQAYVSVYNEQGVLLQSSDVQAGRNSISLKKMPAGVLIINIYSDSGDILSTEKIMHR